MKTLKKNLFIPFVLGIMLSVTLKLSIISNTFSDI